MYCIKCGKEVESGACTSCGHKVKAKGLKKVMIILGSIFAVLIAIFLIVFLTSNRMVCRSPEGNITIMYNRRTITGYAARNMGFDLNEQQKVAREIGIEAYLEEFSYWFETNTSGSCER